jgi:hypothetical protein
MSDETKKSKSGDEDPKARFREALERKKQSGVVRNNNISGNQKVTGGQTSGNTPKMFRRKSGSA